MNKKDIEHIADLAKLELSDKEVEEMTPELSAIVDYIEQLKEVDTAGIQATAQVTGQTNVLREDVRQDWASDERASALNQTPCGLENGQIKVKKVL